MDHTFHSNVEILSRWPLDAKVSHPFSTPGVVIMPGTTQLKAKDILYRLQASQAKAIVTTGSLIPEVDSVASECPALKTKLVVSDHSHDGWLNFQSLMK